MSNTLNKKVIDNIEVVSTIPQTKTRQNSKQTKTKPKHEFTEAAREGFKFYQEQRDDNKFLSNLNKKYSTKTISRREALKQKLLNNPIFANDYKKIFEAFNNGIKLDDIEHDILKIFEYKPLQIGLS